MNPGTLFLTKDEARTLKRLIANVRPGEETRLLRDFFDHLTDPTVKRKFKTEWTEWIKEVS